MIEREEIDEKAREFAILPANVERDYVFGWILFGVFTTSSLKDTLFLKGGNALRKGYFENTRFSGDLDLGMTGDISEATLLGEINKVCEFVQASTGVNFTTARNAIREKFLATEGPSATPNLKVYEVRVYFLDFYGKPGQVVVRISMDITRFDKTILPLQRRPLIHPYSDRDHVQCEIPCMKLEEIVATKLKCLMQREHAPDLFDYVYAIKQLGMELDRGEVLRTFIQKTIFGRNPFVLKSILRDATPLEFIRATWSVSVVCAQKFTMDVEEAIATFVADLELLFAGYSDNGYAQFVYFPAVQRAIIRRAGREQTLLRVQYKGSERVVEPYSLKYMQKRSGEEQEYLYVYNKSGGDNEPGMRSFVPLNLSAIENTDEHFTPQYPIELSKAGETPDENLLFNPNKPTRAPRKRAGIRTQRRSPVRSAGWGTPKHIFKCPVCGKRFTRSTYDSSLRPHKGKNGYQCYGSYGVFVKTTY